VKSIFWAILLGVASNTPSFGQFALNTSAITSTAATLRWNKSTDQDVKGYRLHCGLTPGGKYSRFVDVGNATTYTLSNLIPGKKYYCVVTSYNRSGKESPPSNEISFTVSPAIAPAITSSTVALAWDRSPSRGVKGYRLHYGTASRGYSSIIDVGNVTTYKISNLTAGKTYYVVVTSYDKAGRESPVSNEISFTVSSPASNKRK
jgi:fibronectin type 3 domain-containing protein